MNFEEKVLTMLTEMQATQIEQGKQLEALAGKVDGIDSRLAKVEATQAEQGKQLGELKVIQTEQGKRLAELTDKVNRLDKKIDRDVVPYVKMLDEDYSRTARRVTALEKAK